jgi:hypothetical protein
LRREKDTVKTDRTFCGMSKKKRTKRVIEETLTPTTQLDRVPEQTQGIFQEPT